jgi:D-amino-acid oxidase
VNRRLFLQRTAAFAGCSAVGLTGCTKKPIAASVAGPPSLPFYDALGPITPIRADVDRIFRITVCLRPFRAAGPRLDAERLGDKVVVHNYGHGGSGWSLSWGSADVVVRKALDAANGKKELAVIGCGALGLTAATTAQRAGLKVTIYAKERPPYVRSSRATGAWTPDSRIALTSAASPNFAADWESMARTSFAMYQSYLGMPGTPIEWADRYELFDEDRAERRSRMQPSNTHDFAHYEDRIADLTPQTQDIPAGASVSHQIRSTRHITDLQRSRLRPSADERFYDRGRHHRDPGISIAAGYGVACPASDHQLHWIRSAAIVV